jgi:ABC-type Na+ efflux pump permease subunit
MFESTPIGKTRINFLRVGWTLFKRDITERLLSPITYIGMTAVCLLSTFMVLNYLDTLEKLAIIVSVDPSRATLFFAVIFMALYLGVASSMSIAQEREHRTLEVLFCGPITHSTYVLSKFCRDVAVFFIFLVVLLCFLILESKITNVAIGPKSLYSIGLSFFLIWPTFAFCLLISSLVKRVRKAILIFIIVVFILGIIQAAHGFLYSMPPDNVSFFLLYIRQALTVVLAALQWVSHISYIAAATGGMPASVPISLFWYVMVGVLYSIGLLFLTITIMRKRGIYG